MKRFSYLLAAHLWRSSSHRAVIEQDVRRWVECLGWGSGSGLESAFLKLMAFLPEYRTLFYHRLRADNERMRLRRLGMLLQPPEGSLRIETSDIGPGCFIQHGVGTVIAAHSVGENAWINQQVTIGWKDESGAPRLGNNVTINAGALVIGNIEIGDGAVVGAGAVVLRSIAPLCTVVGNPARIVRRNGKRVDEKL